MKRRISSVCMVIVAMSAGNLFGQQNSSENVPQDIIKFKRPRQTVIFFNVSESGMGVGLKMYYQAINQDTKIGYGFMIGGVRGENESIYVDPYDPFGYPRKIGNDFFTIMVPLNVSIKHRLFREAIESTMRPFIVAEVGPVWGIAFPSRDLNAGNGSPNPSPFNLKNDYSFGKKLRKGKGQLSVGLFAGFGVEFGSEETKQLGFTLGFHYIKFPDALGERAEYMGINLRFSFLTNF